MGLIKAGLAAISTTLGDQWKEFFVCDALPENVLAVKGQKKIGSKSSNRNGSDNVISNGSGIIVADGQCMIIVEQGKVVEVCAEPGEFTYNNKVAPSLFTGKLGDSIKETFKQIGKRFTYGGDVATDQRVYYFNTKELMGNKYGTAAAVPFRVVDKNINMDMEIYLKCFGEYSYHICDPLLFYTNVCGNITDAYKRDRIDSQLKTELLTALQPAFGKIAEQGIRYYAITSHVEELAAAMNDTLSEKWRDKRGIEIVSMGVSSVKANEEDEKTIREFQRKAMLRDPSMREANMNEATAQAMVGAANNTATGPAMAFMGMNMANNAGQNYQNQQLQQQVIQMQQQMAQMQQQQMRPNVTNEPAPDGWLCPSCGKPVTGKFCPECGTKKPEPKPAEGSWVCPSCGKTVSGKFCPECGTKKPEEVDGWVCPSCGKVNKGKFCAECGTKKPQGVPQYKCDKCGWEPEDPTKPPKFCPECGDPFGDEDIK